MSVIPKWLNGEDPDFTFETEVRNKDNGKKLYMFHRVRIPKPKAPVQKEKVKQKREKRSDVFFIKI